MAKSSEKFITWLPNQEWEVEKIISQNLNFFLVKWQNWDSCYNTWEPRENVEGWEGFYDFECEQAKNLGLPIPPRGVRGGIKKCQRRQEKEV